MNPLPHPPFGEYVSAGVDWIKDNLSIVLQFIQDLFNDSTNGLTDLFLLVPPLVLVVLLAVLAAAARSLWFALFTLIGMGLIVSMELWPEAMETLSMVIIATVVAVVLGIPLGILAARNSVVSAIVRPCLDFLQTMPALVYLVPVVLFFSIGFAPGVVATIVFSMAPGVRLTELGIRQVDKETVEAGHAFGGTRGQILRGIQLPLGLPTIMAGVNQVIMLALSMAVLAGFVGSPGLGKIVVEAQARVDVGAAFEAGLSIVIVAIFLDRITAAIGQPTNKSIAAFIRRRRLAAKQAASEQAEVAADENAAADDATTEPSDTKSAPAT